MEPKPPVIVIDRFPEERAALLALLADLTDGEWHAPTACGDWSAKDVAAHVLGGDLGNLSGGRDRYGPGHVSPGSWEELVAFINQHNERWVRAMRPLSPRVIRELLAFSAGPVFAYFRSLDPLAAGVPVDWAGPGRAPAWLHLAREYTERWLHQQHIREAVGRPVLAAPRFLHPVLDTYVHALPHTYRDTPAPEGAHVRLVVEGPAGGEWSLVRAGDGWGLYRGVAADAATAVTMDQDTAWRLFTDGLDREEARRRAAVSGDPALARPLFDAVSIIA